MNRPSIATLTVAALAAHRGARLIAVDSLTAPLRERVLDALDKPSIKRGTTETVNVRLTTAREYAAELIDCPHCVGAHLSYVLLGLYVLAKHRNIAWLRYAIEAAAVAGVQSTLASAQAAMDTLGHIDADDYNEANEAEARNI